MISKFQIIPMKAYGIMDINPDPIYEDQAGLESTLYQNEIARRFSMITQPTHLAGPSGTSIVSIFSPFLL